MKIMSVDDSGIIRRIIKSAVGVLGAEFLEAADGAQAITLLEEHHTTIALVIMDWNMPVQDGYTTLLQMKNDPRFQHIPVMMATTEAERSNVIKAIQAGAKHYLTKPFTQEDLITRMMEVMEAGAV